MRPCALDTGGNESPIVFVELTRRNTILLLTIGTSLAGLAADRLFLDGSLSEPRGAAAAMGVEPDAGAAAFKGAVEPDASPTTVAQRLASAVADGADVPDAMRLPEAWAAALRASRSASATNEHVAVEEAPFQPRLTAVVAGADGARAKIDGALMRVGEVLAGWTLVSVGPRSAVFERGGERHEARLSAR